jgi:hypothetical protein
MSLTGPDSRASAKLNKPRALSSLKVNRKLVIRTGHCGLAPGEPSGASAGSKLLDSYGERFHTPGDPVACNQQLDSRGILILV